MRKTTGILLATASLLSLSACSIGAAPSCESPIPLGGLAETVTTSGEFSEMPAPAAFPLPLVASSASRAITDVGDGRLVELGDAVDAMVTIYDGATGEAIDGGEILLFNADPELPMLAATTCATVGSRVVTALPATELFGGFTTNFGIEADATLVAILDIHAAYPGRASGVAVNQVEGLPAVVTAPSGQPGLVFSGAAAPTELTVETLIQGDGEVVQAGDAIVVNYVGIEWETRKVFDTSWTTGRPHTFSLNDVVSGFQEAVIGAKAGSQLLIAIPPSAGYGDQPGSPVGPTSTMIFVVDLLGVAAPH